MSKGPTRSDRGLSVRLKTANKRTLSQQKWLERQLNDPFVARARREGWKSRAAFKLIEIDDKYHLLKPGQRLVDLGAAPGGWTQVAAKRLKAGEGAGHIVAIDLLAMDAVAGAQFIECDFMAEGSEEAIIAALGGPADGVLSDMAANTSGHRQTDHLRIIGLAEAAHAFARRILAPGGFLLMKLFQGGETAALIGALKQDFRAVRHLKPGASRADSSELYVLATGYRRAAP